MPRTNTEIDRDLDKTKEILRELQRTIDGFERQIEFFQIEFETQIEFFRKEIELRATHSGESIGRVESSHERTRAEQSELRTSLAEFKTELRELKKTVEEDRKQRRALWAGLILAIVAAILGLGKDYFARAFARATP